MNRTGNLAYDEKLEKLLNYIDEVQPYNKLVLRKVIASYKFDDEFKSFIINIIKS